MQLLKTAEKRALRNRGFSRFFSIAGVRPLMHLSNTAKKRGFRNRGFFRLFRGGLMV